MTIDTKSPDQSVAQQLTTTTTHELIAPLLIAVVKSPIAPSVVADVKSPLKRWSLLIWNFLRDMYGYER